MSNCLSPSSIPTLFSLKVSLQKHLVSITLCVKPKTITVLIKKFPSLTSAWQLSEKEDLPEEFCYFLTTNSQEGFRQFFHGAWLLAWKLDLLKYPIPILFSLQVTLGGVLTTVTRK